MVGVSGSLAQAAIADAGSFTAAHTIGAANAISLNTKANTSQYSAERPTNDTNCASGWDKSVHWKIRFRQNPRACIGRHIGDCNSAIKILKSVGAWTWLAGCNETSHRIERYQFPVGSSRNIR
jgi:hypothetical protein